MDSFRMQTRGMERRVREASYFLVPPPLIAKDALRAHLQGFYGRGKSAAGDDVI